MKFIKIVVKNKNKNKIIKYNYNTSLPSWMGCNDDRSGPPALLCDFISQNLSVLKYRAYLDL